MAKTSTATFDEIVKLAGDFVTRQKGAWDHSAWLDFLSTLKNKGYDVSEDMQANVGRLLEAIKRFYQSTASTQGIEKALTTVAKDSVDFVKAHKAVWGHSDWEAFAQHVQKNTLSLSEETMSYLGGILESVKDFYAISPAGSLTHKGERAVVAQQAVAAKVAEKPAAAKVAEKPAAARVPEKPIAAKAPKTQAKKPVSKGSAAEDDLTAIAGIGPALQRKLKEQGIHSYAQIAALSDADIVRLEENIIKFPGRIKRDDWVGQARRLTQ